MDVSQEMQHQAKALGDPSRFRLFRHIVEADSPVGVAELTELLQFNHNAIRQHLAVLVEAGLVAESNEQRATVGRPRKQYVAREDALSAFGSVSGSYQRLAGLLLEVVTSGDDPYEVGRRAPITGTKEPADTTDADEAEIVGDLVDRLRVDGFEPELSDGGSAELHRCPFADVAATEPGVICELHRGLVDGYLASRGDSYRGELEARDPHQAGCMVTVVVDLEPKA